MDTSADELYAGSTRGVAARMPDRRNTREVTERGTPAGGARARTDVLVIVPFQPASGTFMDGPVRRTSIARINLPMRRARWALEAHLGQSLVPGGERWRGPSRGGVDGENRHRSASAVVLATHLEREGLRWQVLDPGAEDLGWWRRRLREARSTAPHAVAVCTTFVVSAPWLHRLVQVVREALPDAKVLVGGYYYGTSAKEFLSLDADVLCVGEGEARIGPIVRAMRDDPRALEDIPGLYLRRPDGSSHHTGRAEALHLDEVPRTDWKLAERIDPPVRIDRHALTYIVETQRGCVFRCGYCTYRTLADLTLMEAERAADQILDAAPSGAASGSRIDIIDPTASYPPERWVAVLQLLIAKGGAPHPITAYARVSDITEEMCELMVLANVRRLLIGQESGDQRMLNQMRKGTKVADVSPAVRMLERHGIDAILSFIHGYPGETRASIQASRDLLLSLNAGAADSRACTLYRVEPFSLYDFAAVSHHASVTGASHYLGYESSGAMRVDEMLDEVLRTIIEVSRDPCAPVCENVLDWIGINSAPLKERMSGPERVHVHRWIKAIERGLALFLEADLEGRSVEPRELAATTAILERHLPAPALVARAAHRARASLLRSGAELLRRECRAERGGGPGPMTRAILYATALHHLGRPAFGADARIVEAPLAPRVEPPVEPHAEALVALARRPKKGIAAAVQNAKEDGRRVQRQLAGEAGRAPAPSRRTRPGSGSARADREVSDDADQDA